MKALFVTVLIGFACLTTAIRTQIDPACKSIVDGTGDGGDRNYWGQGLDCSGGTVYNNVKGTGYYPSNDPGEGGCVDQRGKALRTLQDYLNGKANYVSVAMDKSISVPHYGKDICIPQLNRKYGKRIRFRIVDNGGAFNGQGSRKIDICTRTERDSYDDTINGKLTVHLYK